MNKPGAASVPGTDAAARSKNDGYTMVYASAAGIVYAPASSPDTVKYDPVKDLEPGGPLFFSAGHSLPWGRVSSASHSPRDNQHPLILRCPFDSPPSRYNVIDPAGSIRVSRQDLILALASPIWVTLLTIRWDRVKRDMYHIVVFWNLQSFQKHQLFRAGDGMRSFSTGDRVAKG